MGSVSWNRAEGAAPWMITSREGTGVPVIAGITFGAGWLHQPTEQLGVFGLLAARLATGLTVPVEASDSAAFAEPAQTSFSIGQTDSSLVAVGSAAAVCDALRRVDQLLAEPVPEALLEGLRGRALAHANSLTPWRVHLATRWPGHYPHLSALGPLALDKLDAAALAEFVAQRFGLARRVYWTNEPTVAELLGPAAQPGAVDWQGSMVEPRHGGAGPGCVLRRSSGELFSLAVRQSSATRVGVTLLARLLHRRLVELESLAMAVRLAQYDLGGELALVCGDADLLPGKDTAACEAVAHTLEDLTAGSAAAEEIVRARDTCVRAVLAADLSIPAGIVPLTRQHLRLDDFPTPETIAAAFEEVTGEQAEAALAEHRRQLLLAAPESSDASWSPPYPIIERTGVRPAEGQRFRDWTLRTQSVRCSDRRVSTVEMRYSGRYLNRRLRPFTVASADFNEVVLRLDSGDQQSTLVDQRLRSLSVVWGKYRRAKQLRYLVDGHTVGVPVVQVPDDPEWPGRLATFARKRRRRRLLLPVYALAGVALIVAVSMLTNRASQPVDVILEPSAVASLPNGTTLSISEGPELIEHFDAYIANLYTVQLRMCGGTDRVRNGIHEARNYFGQEKFALFFGEGSANPRLNITSLPTPRGGYVSEGECSTGWLLFALPHPMPAQPLVLRYSNIKDDRVAWRLPSDPPLSPLSKTCPAPAPPGQFGPPPLAGCD